jgi:hypothetical protein
MKRLALLLAITGALGALVWFADSSGVRGVYHGVPRVADDGAELLDGERWRLMTAWDSRDGDFPAAWSWGHWRFTDGLLEGRSDSDSFSVYFTPFTHPGDFLLETRVRILSGAAGHPAEAHLLTRDSNALNNESGAVLFGGVPQVSVRHMLDRREYVLQVVRPPRPVTEGEWHLLRFSVRDGRVETWLDGERLFRSDRRYPVGVYREPHFAVRYGVAQFSALKIYMAR